MDRYRPRYTPGFAEHQIPVPFAWFDRVAPWTIIIISILIWLMMVWEMFG